MINYLNNLKDWPWATGWHRYWQILVVLQMVKNALSMTSPQFISATKDKLREILRRSSYPNPFITDILCLQPSAVNGNDIFADMDKSRLHRFVSCPFNQQLFDDLKSVIIENGLPIKLAPAPFANNRSLLYSRIKDKCTTNKKTLFRARCNDCSFAFMSTNGAIDVQRTILMRIADTTSTLAKHSSSFPQHTLSSVPEIVKVFHNIFDVKRSQNVMNDVGRILPK